MSSSEFFFKENARDLKDSIIGRFLDELELLLRKEDIGWLKSACKVWQEDWRTMPPGCKDIDLNLVITDESRKKIFREKVIIIQELIEEKSVKDGLGRILELTA